MRKENVKGFLKKVLAVVMACSCVIALGQTDVTSVKADDASTTVLSEGDYLVPVSDLKSKAPIPAVQTAFAKAFGDNVEVQVDADGNATAIVSCQNMVINFMGTNYANVLSIKGGTILSTKTEKSTPGLGATAVDKEVPNQISFPLNVDENGKQVLTITVDFMNAFLAGGSDYPTDVTLTLDMANAVRQYKSYTATASLLKADANEASMAAGVFTGAATITDKEDSYTVTVNTQALTISMMGRSITSWMTGLQVAQADGTYVDATAATTDENGNVTSFSFDTASLQKYYKVKTVTSGRSSDAVLAIASDEITIADNTEDVYPSPVVEPTEDTSDDASDTEKEDTKEDTTSTYADGYYSVNVALWNATSDKASMAASSLKEKAYVEIKDGVATMTIQTQSMTFGSITASLQKLQVMGTDGNYTEASIYAKDASGNPTSFQFALPSYDSYITVLVNPMVAMMGNQDIPARIKIDYTSLASMTEADYKAALAQTQAVVTSDEQVAGIKTDASKTNNGQTTSASEAKASTATASTPSTGDSNHIVIYILAFACGFALVAFLASRKKKGIQ